MAAQTGMCLTLVCGGGTVAAAGAMADGRLVAGSGDVMNALYRYDTGVI